MSATIGIVLDNSSDGFARIKTSRTCACGGCDSSSGHCHNCGSSGLNDETLYRVKNWKRV